MSPRREMRLTTSSAEDLDTLAAISAEDVDRARTRWIADAPNAEARAAIDVTEVLNAPAPDLVP